jgi:hypothetical protein
VRHAQIRFLVTLVKKQHHNKTLELHLYVLALQVLIQLQTMTVLIVWLIVKHVQMQLLVILVSQHLLRQ